MRDHTKLRAFQLADQLALVVYKCTASFPKEEMFGLTSQIRRAAVSEASNIVDRSARFSEAEYIHFLNIAYESAREIEYQIGISHRLGLHQRNRRARIGETPVLAELSRGHGIVNTNCRCGTLTRDGQECPS